MVCFWGGTSYLTVQWEIGAEFKDLFEKPVFAILFGTTSDYKNN